MLTQKKHNQTDGFSEKRKLRLWPGIILAILLWLFRFIIPVISPEMLNIGVFSGLIGGLAIFIWWAFFSRAGKLERWGAILLMVLALFATSLIIDKSISTAMMGLMFWVYAIPVLWIAFVIWAIVSRNFEDRLRRVLMVATILLTTGFWALLRTNGMTGEAHNDFEYRWAPTPEERLLSQATDETMELPASIATIDTVVEWPGFRGSNRDGIIAGVKIATDWTTSPPVELWRRPIGPGCSSFAIQGSLVYTQEQRGDDEMVSCYHLKTGKPVWIHADKARFWDSHAGAGPRGTPTLRDGRVYSFGATGILNVLNSNNGNVIWSRNAASDAQVKIPEWGFASSPLVFNDLVVVAVAGKLTAYDIETGTPRWFGPDDGGSYSSPQLLTIDGMEQILLLSSKGASGFNPVDGKQLWKYPWAGEPILQPALTQDGYLMLGAGDLEQKLRCVAVKHKSDGWSAEESWTTANLKPYFNDIVLHKGYAFGFYGPHMVCVDVKDGARMWKGKRYAGFSILLAEQDLIIMLSERGEIALIKATPDKFTELGSFQAIKGKTWSHPVLVGDIILVRNSQEMAAYRLSKPAA